MLCAGFLPSICICQAQEPNQGEAFEILQKSRSALLERKSSKMSFEEKTKHIQTNTTSYSRFDPDGFTVRRTEFESFNTKTNKEVLQLRRVVISNRDGQWDVFGNTAIKKQFLQDIAKQIVQDAKQSDRSSPIERTCEFTETWINGSPCYLVRESISKQSRDELKKIAGEAIAIAKPDIIAGFSKAVSKNLNLDKGPAVPYLTEYVIRKSDFALLSQKEYSEDGDLVRHVYYDSVIFGLPLADNLFEISSGTKKKTASNLFEYLSLRKEATNKQ